MWGKERERGRSATYRYFVRCWTKYIIPGVPMESVLWERAQDVHACLHGLLDSEFTSKIESSWCIVFASAQLAAFQVHFTVTNSHEMPAIIGQCVWIIHDKKKNCCIRSLVLSQEQPAYPVEQMDALFSTSISNPVFRTPWVADMRAYLWLDLERLKFEMQSSAHSSNETNFTNMRSYVHQAFFEIYFCRFAPW